MILFSVGSTVLVNGSVPGMVVEAKPNNGAYTFTPFVSYLVRFEDGTEEGFTGAYLSAP